MLAIAAAVLGLFGPFLPELLKWFNRREDNKQELRLLEMRFKYAAAEHEWRMGEIEAKADIAEAREIHKPQPSYGVQLVDAMDGKGWPAWVVAPLLYLFALLDFITGLVRPAITYGIVGFYLAYKWARFELMKYAAGDDMTWFQQIANLWDENDLAVLLMVLSFWFGGRIAKYAFGIKK